MGVLLALGMIVSIAPVCRGIETENSDVVDLTRPLGPGLSSFTIEETPGDEDGEAPGGAPGRRFVFAYEPGLTGATGCNVRNGLSSAGYVPGPAGPVSCSGVAS